MEPYNNQSNKNDNKFWGGLRENIGRVSYPTTHLFQKQNDRGYNFHTLNNNPNNFKKTSDIGQSTGIQYWQQERGVKQNEGSFRGTFNETSPERKKQLEHSPGWRQDKYPQRMSRGNGTSDDSSRRIVDTVPSRSSFMDSERKRFTASHPNILDIDYGFSRRSPSAGTNNYRTNRYESPEQNQKKQEYRDYDSQNNYYSRRSPNLNTTPSVGKSNYALEASPAYESRRDVQNKKSLTSNYRGDYEINRPFIFQSNTRDRDEYRYSLDHQRYSDGRDSSNKNSFNSGSNLQFFNDSSYDSQRLHDNKSFPGRSDRSKQMTSLIDSNLRGYQGPNKNPTIHKNPLEPIQRFDQPALKSVGFPTSSVDHTSIQKRKQQADECELIPKKSRIQTPIANSIHKTNNMQFNKPFIKKSTTKQPFKSANIGGKSKPLTMAEEYIRHKLVRNPVSLTVNNTFGRKPTPRSVMQPSRLPNVKQKNRPSTMAEEHSPSRLPNVIEKSRPSSMAEEYLEKLKNQKSPVKYLKASVNNQKVPVKPHPVPTKENVEKKWEVLLVPKNYPFYRFTVEENEELKIALLGKSEKHPVSVSCRKKARLLHFDCSNKDLGWIKNVCKMCSPWKGNELKIIKVNYEPPQPVAIYSNEFPIHAMTYEQLKKVTEFLAAKMLESPNEKCIEIVELIRRRGNIIVYCNNKESLDWLMAVSQDLAQSVDNHLVISPALAFPNYYLCEVVLPKTHIDVNKAFARLDRQNDNLNTKTWFKITKTETPTEHKVLVSVEESVLKALEITEYKPFLDFGRIEVILKGEMKRIKDRFCLPK